MQGLRTFRNKLVKELFSHGKFKLGTELYLAGIGYLRNAEFDFLLNNVRGLNILDVASPKLVSLYLSQTHIVKATDLWKDEIDKWAKIEKNILPRDIDFILDVQDATKLTYPEETFDCVYSISVIEHIEDDEKALSEMMRVLKKNGKLILTTIYNEPPQNVYFYGKQIYSKKSNTVEKMFYERRYNLTQLEQKFLPTEITYVNERISIYYPLFYLVNNTKNKLLKNFYILIRAILLNNFIGKWNFYYTDEPTKKTRVACMVIQK